jgi:hypothetical protein
MLQVNALFRLNTLATIVSTSSWQGVSHDQVVTLRSKICIVEPFSSSAFGGFVGHCRQSPIEDAIVVSGHTFSRILLVTSRIKSLIFIDDERR